jgi:hypothetical protein
MVSESVLNALWSVYGMPDYKALLELDLQGKTQEEVVSAIYSELLIQGDISNNLEFSDAQESNGIDSYIESLKISIKRNSDVLSELRKTADEAYKLDDKDNFESLIKKAAQIEDKIEGMRDKVDDLINENITDEDKQNMLFDFAQKDIESYRSRLTTRKAQDRKTENSSIDMTNNELDGISKVLRVLQRADEIFITPELEDLSTIDSEAYEKIVKIKAMKSDAQNLLGMVDVIHKNELDYWHNRILGKDNVGELVGEDIDGLTAQFLDLSHVDDPIAQSLYREIKRISSTAAYKSKKKADKLNELYKPLVKLYGKKKLMNMLQEKDSDNNNTGNLSSEIDALYYEEMSIARESGKKTLKEWMKENISTISAFSLTTDVETESDLNARENLGDELFEERKKEAKQKLRDYKYSKEAMWSSIETKYEGDPERIAEAKKRWDHKNSPYIYEQFIAGDDLKSYRDENNELLKGVDPAMIELYGNPTRRFVVQFPSKSKHYSKQYKEIQNNEALKEYYNELRSSLESIHKSMPYSKRKGIHSNTIPFVSKNIVEQFQEEGMKEAGATMWESFKQSFKQKEDSKMFFGFQDPYDGYTEDYLDGPVYDNNRLKEEEYQILRAKMKDSQGNIVTNPSPEDIVKLRKQAATNVANQSTDDFNSIIMSYTYASESYKMKSQIEDMVKISQNIMSKRLEKIDLSENNGKSSFKETFQGNIFTKGPKGSFSQLNELINFHINSQFYDKSSEDKLLKSKKKTYTAKEKAEKEELEELLKTATTEEQKKSINNKIDRLGGFLSGANTIDNAMLYVQNKGMAFNLPAGVANYLQGNIAAWTHAAGGRDFSSSEFRKAWWITNQSLGKGITQDGKKMMLLMEHFDILKDSSEELYTDDSVSQFGNAIAGDRKWMKRFSSFYINKKVEYMNQAPTMAAMLMNRGLWDKFDVKDDKLVFEGEEVVDNDKSMFHVTSDEYHKQRLQIDHIIKKLNGNYDPYSRVQIKKTALGRAAMQFRSWIPELINERFGEEKNDRVMGRKERGRYRDLITMKGIKGLLWNTIPFYSKDVMDENGNIDDLASHNAKKNAKELQVYLMLAATGAALSALAADDDDEAWYFNMLVNNALRARKDLEFFANPFEAEKISKNILPLMSVMSDGWGVIHALAKFGIGEDEITNGDFTGDSRLSRELMQSSPLLLPQLYRLYSMGSQIYDK